MKKSVFLDQLPVLQDPSAFLEDTAEVHTGIDKQPAIGPLYAVAIDRFEGVFR